MGNSVAGGQWKLFLDVRGVLLYVVNEVLEVVDKHPGPLTPAMPHCEDGCITHVKAPVQVCQVLRPLMNYNPQLDHPFHILTGSTELLKASHHGRE